LKIFKTLMLFTLSLGLVGGSLPGVTASAKGTTIPKKLRGSYYSYQGKHQWSHLKIAKHKASLKYPGEKTFYLTPKAKNKAKRLSYATFGSYFSLNSKIKSEADSPFPELGMRLTSRKIKNRHYKVIRGYQAGHWFDFIKGGQKITHYYSGLANGKM